MIITDKTIAPKIRANIYERSLAELAKSGRCRPCLNKFFKKPLLKFSN